VLEAAATALVLCKLVSRHVLDIKGVDRKARELLPELVKEHEPLPQSVTTCCFVLSNGVFKSKQYIAAMLQAAEKRTRHCPIIAEDGFRFPSEAMFKDLREYLPNVLPELNLSAFAKLVKDMFREIAVVFAPQDYSSDVRLLNVKAKEVAERLMKGQLQQLSWSEDAQEACREPSIPVSTSTPAAAPLEADSDSIVFGVDPDTGVEYVDSGGPVEAARQAASELEDEKSRATDKSSKTAASHGDIDGILTEHIDVFV
jgi:hypothetical protein